MVIWFQPGSGEYMVFPSLVGRFELLAHCNYFAIKIITKGLKLVLRWNKVAGMATAGEGEPHELRD
jgi:hypothetical protein